VIGSGRADRACRGIESFLGYTHRCMVLVGMGKGIWHQETIVCLNGASDRSGFGYVLAGRSEVRVLDCNNENLLVAAASKASMFKMLRRRT